ncbi:MAG TPA: hypothetical protein VLC07_03915, partial [Solirubrobacterales bacterium]|nr:hypothetical protein [Solirubrobacterales bacterium]
LGDPSCRVPTCDRRWIKTLPPVVLDRWPVAEGAGSGALTTIGHWRSYGSTEHDGVRYGQRAHSLRRFFELPRRVRAPLELALGIHPDETEDLVALRSNGWRLVDPEQVAGTPEAYAAYVAGSSGELGIAKSGYVDSRSGWFSDRSACYLASGRPVVAQATGFEEALPVGEGLLAFATTEEAAAAIEAVGARPQLHRRRAREIAEEHLDARAVLSRLLVELASSQASPPPGAGRAA